MEFSFQGLGFRDDWSVDTLDSSWLVAEAKTSHSFGIIFSLSCSITPGKVTSTIA